MKRSRVVAALGGVVLLAGLAAQSAAAKPPPGSPAAEKAQTTKIQILGLNDFHGQLVAAPTSSSAGRIGSATNFVAAGGVEYLATHVRALRAENPNTLFVSAGDLIGATPLLSALFHDEPTIEAFNLMGLDYNGVGNHEFDEGVDELLRMQYGNQLGGDGCHPVDGCGDETPFGGATFDFLAANVKYKDGGETIFPPYAIHHFDGVKVAIIGMTTVTTPTIVTPGGIASVDFLPEAASVNALVPVLKRQGIETIIVLLHEGGSTTVPGNGSGQAPPENKTHQDTVNQCVNVSGVLPAIVADMDDEVDVVVTGHTNWAVNCVIDGKIVTGAAAQGRLITDIDLTVNRATKDVVAATVNNRIVTQTVDKAPDLTQLIADYNVFAGPIGARVVGRITAPITTGTTTAGESALGDVIADAQLHSTTPVGAQLALMNPGGIRASLTADNEADKDVTHAEAFAVQPFSNILVTMDLTGEQLKTILEQQFASCPSGGARPASTAILQVSAGFSYTYTASAANCTKVSNMVLNGQPVLPGTPYRVTMNNFLATGGDSFPGFTVGTNVVFGADDLVALEAYFAAFSPVAPGPQNRITRIP